MNQVPYRHLHKIYLTLDIKRADGRDVREFASKLKIPIPEFERLQREAEIQKSPTTSVILAQQVPSSWTVGDFVNIMKEMERKDIIDLINEWEWERDRFYRSCTYLTWGVNWCINRYLGRMSINISATMSVEISAEWLFPVGEYRAVDQLTVGRDRISSDCQQCISKSSVKYR